MTTKLSSSKKIVRKMHPNSLANLIPYKPGENGHKGGYNLTERLRHSLDKPLKVLKSDAPVGEQIVQSWIEGTLLREPTPFREALERIDGKVPEPARPLPEGYQDNRTINIIVSSEKAKDLTDNVFKRLLPKERTE